MQKWANIHGPKINIGESNKPFNSKNASVICFPLFKMMITNDLLYVHGRPQKFLQGGGQTFFYEISVKQRFYSISLTLFKILHLKTDAIYDDYTCMKTVAH